MKCKNVFKTKEKSDFDDSTKIAVKCDLVLVMTVSLVSIPI